MNRYTLFIKVKLCVWFGFILLSAAGVNDKGNLLDTYPIHSSYSPRSHVARPGTESKGDLNKHSSNKHYNELKSNFFRTMFFTFS